MVRKVLPPGHESVSHGEQEPRATLLHGLLLLGEDGATRYARHYMRRREDEPALIYAYAVIGHYHRRCVAFV